MAQGTIHIKTTKRNGVILWEGVWCAACVAEHRRIFGQDRGVTITTWPWTGEARPCDSCDDSENAPEFKVGAVVVLLLVCLLMPGLASAQSAPVGPQVALVLGNVADLVSTEIVIAQGRGREGNPIMGQSTGRRVALKAAATAAQVWIVRRVGKRHPVAAKVFGYSFGSFLGGVTVWNLSR